MTPDQLPAVVADEKRRRSSLPSAADIEAAAQLMGIDIPDSDMAELLGLATPSDYQRCVRVKLDARTLGLPEADVARIDRIIDKRMKRLKGN